jgi:thymidylate kinase
MRKRPEAVAQNWPHCIHLTGVDGSGKSTQAGLIQSWFERQGIPARCVWLRFPRLFCVPFLIYARLRGYSRRETVGEHQHGYWDFGASWFMAKVFPWALLLDAFLLALVKVYLPLWRGYTVICDRFVVDVLADLMTGFNDNGFDECLPGRLFLALLPRGARVVVLDLDTETARRRCPELKGDHSHAKRRAIYLDIARRRRLPVVSTEPSIEATMSRLIAALSLE